MQPRQTWLCENPRSRDKTKKKKRAPRIDQRPVIRVFDPTEARKIYAKRDDKGTHASPIPHMRRAHSRTYRHERYKNVRGKSVSVGATMVNAKIDEEFEVNKKIYLVMKAGDTDPKQGIIL